MRSVYQAAIRIVHSVLARANQPRRVIPQSHRHRRIWSLARSNVLDLEYYEIQAKRQFRSKREAAVHYIDCGYAAGLAVTPFYQEAWHREHARSTDSVTFMDFFFKAEALSSTTPLFDAHVFAAGRSAVQRIIPVTGRQALEWFLAEAQGDTVLPVHRRAVGTSTLREGRDCALATMRWTLERESFLRPRLAASWPADTEKNEAIVAVADKSDTLVSVIMPVRNRPELIPLAIQSVIAQTYSNWELIVVDDGSTDTTSAVVAEFAEADSRVKLIRQGPIGVCAARNNGLSYAQGALVAFIDSDNAWVPHFLDRSVFALDHSKSLGTYAAAELNNERGEIEYLAFTGSRDDLLFGGNFIDLNTLVVRRDSLETIGGFDENLRRWVDYDLVIRLFALGEFEFLAFIGVIYSHRLDIKRISTMESPGWEQVVLSKYLLDWKALDDQSSTRMPDLVSIVMLTYADWRFTLDAVRSVLDNSGTVPFELLVVDNGSPPEVHQILALALAGESRVRLVSLTRNLNFALGANVGFSLTLGAHVVFLNNDVIVEENWLEPLLAEMRNPRIGASQSLIRHPNGMIESAGLSIRPPTNIPQAIKNMDGIQHTVNAVSCVSAVFRAVDIISQRGFDPHFANGFEDADLSLRLNASSDCTFTVALDSRVTHYSSFSPGRFLSATANEQLFSQRWQPDA